jgi:hypothetical protein
MVGGLARFRTRSEAWLIARTEPRPDGLPNMLVLLWFPALVVLGVLVLVVAGISGSSTGQWWVQLGSSDDPNLLGGMPRPVRSDEWLVQSSWVVSQVAQGLPATNTVFPGGMDATIFNDLPSRDWSTMFRPHLWAFFLSLDQGMALRWWLPAALVVICGYCFAVSILPRHGALAAVLAVAAFWQPNIQWWFMPVTLLPIAFAFAAMTAVVWCVRSRTLLGRVVPSIAAGYLAAAMVMGIYVPFIVPAMIVTIAFAAGYVIDAWRSEGIRPAALARRLAPLAAAGVGAGVVAGLWVLTRKETIDAVLGTVYPGQRLASTGTVTTPQLVEFLSAPFQRSLQVGVFDGFAGGNQSEASSPVLVSIFLLIPMVWWLARQARRGLGIDWLVLAIVVVQVVLLAFMLVPGWDWLAHLTLLDRSPAPRLRPAFLVLGVVAFVVLAHRLRRAELRVPWVLAVAGGACVVASSAFVWNELSAIGSRVVPSTYAIVITAAVTIAVVAIARRHLMAGAVLLLGCAAVIGAGVNPLYRGVVDLSEDTAAGREVQRLTNDDPSATWVGVGSFLSMATIVETGVHGYSGVQTYPPARMWNQIDPSHRYEQAWNRLAHIAWTPGAGDPAPRITTPDQILLTFDSCADFAQKHVTYVLVDGAPLRQPCATQIAEFDQGSTSQWIYRVDADRATATP